jgi:hypothetical protein
MNIAAHVCVKYASYDISALEQSPAAAMDDGAFSILFRSRCMYDAYISN